MTKKTVILSAVEIQLKKEVQMSLTALRLTIILDLQK